MDSHSNPKSDLKASAKILTEAAKSGKMDKAKVAGATTNLLDAANRYGKLEQKGYGKYVDKAKNYLQKHSQPPTTTANSGYPADTSAHSSAPAGGGGKTGGGYGEYLKIAQGFLKK